MFKSKTAQGNYYKRKTKEWFEKRGYVCQITEFTYSIPIGRKTIWRKVDVFGSDMICMDGKEIIFINSKATDEFVENGIEKSKSVGKIEFAKYPFPPSTKKQVVVWMPREEPEIFEV